MTKKDRQKLQKYLQLFFYKKEKIMFTSVEGLNLDLVIIAQLFILIGLGLIELCQKGTWRL